MHRTVFQGFDLPRPVLKLNIVGRGRLVEGGVSGRREGKTIETIERED